MWDKNNKMKKRMRKSKNTMNVLIEIFPKLYELVVQDYNIIFHFFFLKVKEAPSWGRLDLTLVQLVGWLAR
jgi:hypothetical protein